MVCLMNIGINTLHKGDDDNDDDEDDDDDDDDNSTVYYMYTCEQKQKVWTEFIKCYVHLTSVEDLKTQTRRCFTLYDVSCLHQIHHRFVKLKHNSLLPYLSLYRISYSSIRCMCYLHPTCSMFGICIDITVILYCNEFYFSRNMSYCCSCASADKPDTTPAEPHPNSNT